MVSNLLLAFSLVLRRIRLSLKVRPVLMEIGLIRYLGSSAIFLVSIEYRSTLRPDAFCGREYRRLVLLLKKDLIFEANGRSSSVSLPLVPPILLRDHSRMFAPT